MIKKDKKLKTKRRELRDDLNLRKAILLYMGQHPKQSLNHKQIAAGAGLVGVVSPKSVNLTLDQLCEEGKLEQTERGRFRFVARTVTITGRLDVVRDGYGFLVPDEGGDDYFVAHANMGKALHGDTVKVRVIKTGRRGGEQRSEAEVLEVVQRANTQWVGTLEVADGFSFLVPDDQRIQTDFRVVGELKGAKDGDKVIFALKSWDYRTPEAEIMRVLGRAGEHETEIHAIIFQFGFRESFPEQVEAEANAYGKDIPADEVKRRRDFRQVTTFTIDPVDAKDFDDALSIRQLENGNWEIGVHIADVSHYVRPGTALDHEAYDRATSVYLVDRTIPMLPEALSNELCSLKPHVDRLAFSSVFEMGMDGSVHNEWFGRTVIHSDRRFAYEEAQAILDAGHGELHEELHTMNVIAKALRVVRFRQGSINFEEDEVKFQLDEKGRPIRVYKKQRHETNKLIEDFMLLANRRVAHWVYRLKTPQLPFIWRIHDSPDITKLEGLQALVSTLGYTIDLSTPKTIVQSMNALMLGVEGKPEQNIVQNVAVRAMAKAVYHQDNIGHYGLGFDYYTHFTSPIRRYPDLMVHRFVAQYLSKDYNYGAQVRLAGQAKHCSNMEKKAADAERASIKYKQVEYLADKVGKEFEALISGVSRWGLYVEVVESKSEGMIPLAAMPGDYYEVDEQNFRIIGRRSGQVINLGDRVMVEVKSTNLQLRQIEFELVSILEQPKRDVPGTPKPIGGGDMRRKGPAKSRKAGGKSAPTTGKAKDAGKPKQRKGGTNTGKKLEGRDKRNSKKGKPRG